MTTEATFQECIHKQEAWHKTFTRSNDLQRFRYFIEESDWDEILAKKAWINRMCIGIMIVALFYFTLPILIMLFSGWD
jgi:hypothetical protein